MTNRPKPYTLSGDPTSETVERVDEMFNTLFTDTGAPVIHALLSATHSDTTPGAVTRGAIITGQGSTPLWTVLPVAASNTFLRSNGTDVVFVPVTLSTTDVTGTLPTGNGGTGLITYAQGDTIYASAANTLSALAKDTNATRYLSNTGASNNPAWARVDLTNGVTGTLPSTSGGTGQSSYSVGTTLYYGGTIGQLDKLALGSNNTFLQAASGVGPQWSAFALPAGVNQGDTLYASSTSVVTVLAKDTNATRYLANTGTSNNPAWNQINLSNGVIGGNGRVTAQTAANASVATYTVGAADASYLVFANVLITASTTFNFTVTVAYTDEGNTARTLTLNFSQLAGTLITAITNILGAGPYEGVPLHIRAKASTTITIATTGTFTSVTYNAEGRIVQI